ncbi:MAG: hypothetical protein NDJ89_16420 [Oligoflexia bacterium]|nr:hypothetical protein [Oligoflexia bacterium]
MLKGCIPTLFTLALFWTFAFAANGTQAADFVVYSVYRPLDMGDGEVPLKDYYVNMGSANGLRAGAVLDVFRRVSTYDLANEKLYKDISFKIASLRVIHVEANAAVARIEKFAAADKIPALAHRYVMIGDTVRPGER